MNRSTRLTGPGAGPEKYDLLTAMAVSGLASGGALQASMMRLMALVTARYNWTLDEVSIGQRDMAALWSVDERTAKRETKRLVEGGFLRIKRPGVRGRVAVYQLNIEAIYRQTEPRWTNVGRDFEARMGARAATPEVDPPSKVVRVDFTARPKSDIDPATGGPWERVLARLAAQQQAICAAWFDPLVLTAIEPDHISLTAPSRFAAQYIATHLMAPLDSALRAEFGRPVRCVIAAPQA